MGSIPALPLPGCVTLGGNHASLSLSLLLVKKETMVVPTQGPTDDRVVCPVL